MNQVELAFERMAKLRKAARKLSSTVDEFGLGSYERATFNAKIADAMAVVITAPTVFEANKIRDPHTEPAISPVAAEEAVAEAVEKFESIKNG